MLIKISSIPYFIVLLASGMPWIAAYFDSKLLVLAPDIVLMTIFALLLLTRRLDLRIGLVAGFVLIATVIHSLVGMLDGRGIGSGGLVLLVIEVLIFYKLLTGTNSISAKDSYTWISRIYKVHLCFLYFEFIMRLAGFTDQFVAIAGHSTVTTIYKTYNTAALLQHFEIMNGLNSLILGSQSASQLSLFALIWFYILFRHELKVGHVSRLIFWLVAAVTMYLLSATMTSNIILVSIIGFSILIFYCRRISLRSTSILFFIILSGIVISLFDLFFFDLILFRINNEADVEIYKEALDVPIEVISSMDIYRQLLGWGRYFDESIISDTNMGLAALIFKTGFLFSGLLIASVIGFVFNLFRLRNRYFSGDLNEKSNAFLGIINGLFAIGWFVSLGHYTPAVELGGRQIFAFHIALSLYYSSRFLIVRKPKMTKVNLGSH